MNNKRPNNKKKKQRALRPSSPRPISIIDKELHKIIMDRYQLINPDFDGQFDIGDIINIETNPCPDWINVEIKYD